MGIEVGLLVFTEVLRLEGFVYRFGFFCDFLFLVLCLSVVF